MLKSRKWLKTLLVLQVVCNFAYQKAKRLPQNDKYKTGKQSQDDEKAKVKRH